MSPPPALPVLLSRDRIRARVESMATEIRDACRDVDEITAVVLLRGAYVFAADLVRALARSGLEVRVEGLALSSYGSGTESSGEVRLRGAPPADLSGRVVLLVEDILDSGRTLDVARREVTERGAARVLVAVLLDKPSRRRVEVEAEHVGFRIEDRFVVGYGLDHDGRYRELPDVAILDPDGAPVKPRR